eukprot:scaffold30186_cov70-Phaeocystis_antarctica.AAC.6
MRSVDGDAGPHGNYEHPRVAVAKGTPWEEEDQVIETDQRAKYFHMAAEHVEPSKLMCEPQVKVADDRDRPLEGLAVGRDDIMRDVRSVGHLVEQLYGTQGREGSANDHHGRHNLRRSSSNQRDQAEEEVAHAKEAMQAET